ncbi:MAG: GNAT family N-acetyltransferase [Lyngbya sp.]|nr:GNAT family N-acetyltransferase [Lyngbya sp.]
MTDRTPPQLETERLILRLPTAEDVPEILRYYMENKQHLTPFEPRRTPEFYTQQYWCCEVSQRLMEFQGDRSCKLFLFNRKNPSEIIGAANFANFIRGMCYSCTLGYSLAAFEQGKGYMSEALKVAIDYVFNELNLRRITAAYIPHNQRSGKLLKRLGFHVDGFCQDYLMINGEWEDHILTSLINYNWQFPE